MQEDVVTDVAQEPEAEAAPLDTGTATAETGSSERTLESTIVTDYDYIYTGDKLTQMTVTTTVDNGTPTVETLYFAYDASGSPMAVSYNGTTYYYVTNLQGDVVALLNGSGANVASYSYDAWGEPLPNDDATGSAIEQLNPLRYRGYVFDSDTGLYYLQSRYYNPGMGRFINADIYTSTGQGLLGNNMFAYCGNNPVSRLDSGGCFFFTVLGATVGAAFGALDAAIQGKTGDELRAMVTSGAISGAVSGAAADVLSFTGAAVGVAVGDMAAAGAIGSIAGSYVEYKMTGNKKIDRSEYGDMLGNAAADAALSGLFAYMSGPIASQMGKIAKKGFWAVAKNFYLNEIKDSVCTMAEEALTTVAAGIAKFTASAYRQAFAYTAELWSN